MIQKRGKGLTMKLVTVEEMRGKQKMHILRYQEVTSYLIL